MKKLLIRLSAIFSVMALLYGVTTIRGIRVPVLDTCMSYCMYPLMLVQNSVVSPIKQYIEMARIHRELEAICMQSLADRQELLRENIELASALDVVRSIDEINEFKKRYSSAAITAQVISRHFDGNSHFFWIDAGKNRDIAVDMVVVYKNCLVGRVTEVLPYFSRVILITDPLCKVAAFCKDSRDQAIHEGTGSLTQTKLTYVFDSRLDLEKRLKKGDLVLSSGEGLIFPKGFGLGSIETFSADDLQFNVTLTPLIDFKTIDYCCVIAKGAEYSEPASADAIKSGKNVVAKPIKAHSQPELSKPKAQEQLYVMHPDSMHQDATYQDTTHRDAKQAPVKRQPVKQETPKIESAQPKEQPVNDVVKVTDVIVPQENSEKKLDPVTAPIEAVPQAETPVPVTDVVSEQTQAHHVTPFTVADDV